MNATKWTTLTEFAKHLGKEGLAVVDETPKGWFIQWIDRSPKALARQEAIAKKERMELDDEQREQKLIQEQMARAAAARQTKTEAEDGEDSAKELVRENEEEKIKLNLSLKPAAGSTTTTKLGGGLLGSGSLLKPKSLNALAAKKPNPFKTASASSTTSTASSPSPTPTPPFAKPMTTPPLPSTSLPASSAESRKRPTDQDTMDAEIPRKRRFANPEGADMDQQAVTIAAGIEIGAQTMGVIMIAIGAEMTNVIDHGTLTVTERRTGILLTTKIITTGIDAEMKINTAVEITTGSETATGT
ncbi:hypothetical protein DFQ26_009573, partial [Actinomortierella ambigua]